MNHEAKQCFNTAADMLAKAINKGECQSSMAAQIVYLIGLGAIRWGAETDPKGVVPQ